jgi:hypothetical protein
MVHWIGGPLQILLSHPQRAENLFGWIWSAESLVEYMSISCPEENRIVNVIVHYRTKRTRLACSFWPPELYCNLAFGSQE